MSFCNIITLGPRGSWGQAPWPQSVGQGSFFEDGVWAAWRSSIGANPTKRWRVTRKAWEPPKMDCSNEMGSLRTTGAVQARGERVPWLKMMATVMVWSRANIWPSHICKHTTLTPGCDARILPTHGKSFYFILARSTEAMKISVPASCIQVASKPHPFSVCQTADHVRQVPRVQRTSDNIAIRHLVPGGYINKCTAQTCSFDSHL